MNYHNCQVCCCHPCCCVPKEPEQKKPLASLTPIITKKPEPKIPVTQVTVCGSGSKQNPIEVTHCPTNKIATISKMGNKVVVTMDDCLYYEAELDTLDLSTLQTNSGKMVVKVDANADNSLTVHYRDLKSGADTKEVITLPSEIYITSGSIGKDKNSIVLEMNDGSVVTIDMTLLKEGIISNITNTIKQLVDNGLTDIKTLINNLTQKVEQYKIKETTLDPTSHVFTIKLNDDETFETDFSSLISADNYVHSGTVLANKTLRLVFKDGTHIDIDLSAIGVASSTVLPTGGRIENTNLILTLSNGSEISIDITQLLQNAVNKVTNNIQTKVITDATNTVTNTVLSKLQFRINKQNEDYELTQEDFDGLTLVYAEKAGNQTITVPKPDNESLIGRVVVIRKAAGDLGSLLTVTGSNGVTITPPDISPLRRVGSEISLVYVGDGVWAATGELP